MSIHKDILVKNAGKTVSGMIISLLFVADVNEGWYYKILEITEKDGNTSSKTLYTDDDRFEDPHSCFKKCINHIKDL